MTREAKARHSYPVKLRIHTWPEKILRTRCKEVKKVDAQISRLLDEMLVLMRIHNGVGLAGNQAGLNLRLITVEAEGQVFKLVNPHIVKKEGSICFTEGCLSFPGLELEVKRANKVRVRALDERGEPLDLEAEGILAVIFQHEIDHINGVAFIERISFWQRLRSASTLKEIIRRTNNGLSKQEKKF
jgi:peptide deformylase